MINQSTRATASPQRAASGWLDFVWRGWGLLLLSLHLAAGSLNESISWSLWPYTFIPNWLQWLLALTVGALIIPTVNNAIAQRLARLWQSIPGKQFPQRWFLAAAMLAGGVFWLARLQHLRWGDSYLLTIALSYHDLDLRVIYNWQAPFTVFLHQRLWQFVADPLLGWPVEHVYATVSITCGVLFVYHTVEFCPSGG